jgi:hypothetical protein
MRNKCCILAFLMIVLPSLAAAQEDTGRNVVVQLPEGGFVAFKSETSPDGSDNTAISVQELQAEFRSQAFADENHVIHRLLRNSSGKYVFGYDLIVKSVPISKTFKIGVRPLDSRTENKLLESSLEKQPARIATLPQLAAPQTLDDGDSFTLDLLVNQITGVKIVDVVKVSFDRATLWNDNLKTLPRDFTLDAVALKVSDSRLLIDGSLVAASKPGTHFAGALIWCYVEGHGRFIFSLVPREGYEFQKVGVLTDNRIEFTFKGNQYEWLSAASILASGGTWNLWVLHDPAYLPFGSQEASMQEKSRLDRLDDSIKAIQKQAPRIGNPTPNTFRRKTEMQQTRDASQSPGNSFHVMVGAADRMENLWPK